MSADLRLSVDDRRLKIYELLKAGLSGSEIARRLGISRSAVWKFVEKLRSLGYEIDSEYKILKAPDPSPLDAALCSRKLGVKEFLFFEDVGSTNDVVKENPKSCALARRQSRGRGRLGRKWFSDDGGLYFSFEFPFEVPVAKAHRVTVLTGLVVARALKDFGAKVKWPNDVLIDGKKVSGILCELVGEELSARIIVGVGVNVRNEIPVELKDRATNLSRFGVSVTDVFCRFCDEFERVVKLSWENVLDEWRSLLDTVGREVEVRVAGEVYRGVVVGVDGEGALLIESDGKVERVFSGECFYLR